MPYKLDIFDMPVNSGALIQVCREGGHIYLSTVEASAASHIGPTYPLSGEAPRIYGSDTAEREYRLAWLEFVAELLGYRNERAWMSSGRKGIRHAKAHQGSLQGNT